MIISDLVDDRYQKPSYSIGYRPYRVYYSILYIYIYPIIVYYSKLYIYYIYIYIYIYIY